MNTTPPFLLALIGLVTISAALVNCGAPPQKKTMAIIFSDVTNSLSNEEREKIAIDTFEIISRLPPQTEYAIYPLGKNIDTINSLFKGTVPEMPRKKDVSAYQAYLGKNKTNILDTIRNYRIEQNISRTCILDTLKVAKQFFANNATNVNQEIIYISDMIEDCDVPVLRRRINLATANIAEEIRSIITYPKESNIADARITIIIPTTRIPRSQNTTQFRDLENYWQAISQHNGVNDQNFYFRRDDMLPDWLKPIPQD